MIVADPEKQDAKQIKILETARNKIDKALEPLSNEEAKLLHDNKTAVDIFHLNCIVTLLEHQVM